MRTRTVLESPGQHAYAQTSPAIEPIYLPWQHVVRSRAVAPAALVVGRTHRVVAIHVSNAPAIAGDPTEESVHGTRTFSELQQTIIRDELRRAAARRHPHELDRIDLRPPLS